MTDEQQRQALIAFALWISPVWDPDNEDDVESATAAVDAYISETW